MKAGEDGTAAPVPDGETAVGPAADWDAMTETGAAAVVGTAATVELT